MSNSLLIKKVVAKNKTAPISSPAWCGLEMDAVVLCVSGDFGSHAAIGAIPLRFIKQGTCQVKVFYRVGI
jgi:hypothetical protein